MTTFDDREQAFEAKFVHDEEMQFKAEARCNKLLGLWAAGQMGKTGRDAEAYALTIVASDMVEAGHDDVIRRVTADLEGTVASDAIRDKRRELMPAAKDEILAEAV